ncbi:hypothetical protein EYZ11_011509 [Aspergillus tanneri]|uniref:Uncharacterized protein n=1 Tax=Aspergillus tanneri TaxID=1220188 RepID=A0A4S3J4S3_9EURO|nr:hypothetical protein EYZ11_011509 [Aspergillus tanneri]
MHARTMSGKRLLDVIQLLNVAKSIAVKHLAVRQDQLDIFTRTSSLTKGIKSQADDLVLTAQAAAALAKRFNEPLPSAPSPNSQSADLARPANPERKGKGFQQQSEFQIPATAAKHTVEDEVSNVDISRQKDVSYRPSQRSTPDLSGLSRVKLPQTSEVQQSRFQNEINADVFHSSAGSEEPTAKQEGVSDDMVNQIFHSPRVARILSRKPAVNSTSIPCTGEVKQLDQESIGNAGLGGTDDIGSTGPKTTPETVADLNQRDAYTMVESRIPSSRLGRLWQYGGLATSMAFGAVGEGLKRVTRGNEDNSGSLMFNAGNMERLVAKLSKMRGAALKLGQMLSFQGS